MRARHDIGLTALRDRARREGWRRRDQADPEPGEADAAMEAEVAALVADPPAPSELAAQAWARAAVALGRGRLRDAQGWTKLWRELTAAADIRERARDARAHAEHRETMDEACRSTRSIVAALKAAPTVKRAFEHQARADEPHSADSMHPVSRAVGGGSDGEPHSPDSADSVSHAVGGGADGGLHSPHSTHSVSGAAPPEIPPRPLNRAERRRRARLAAARARDGP